VVPTKATRRASSCSPACRVLAPRNITPVATCGCLLCPARAFANVSSTRRDAR
jgi:hypothetical protein